jgi:hypothetical protein
LIEAYPRPLEVPPPAFPLGIPAAVGDYRCPCGQAYRLESTTARVRAWPANGGGCFSVRELVAPSCIRCGALLPLN